MPSYDPDDLEPITGDLITPRVAMRAWETEKVRGSIGSWITVGQVIIVIDTWDVGSQRRIKAILGDRILVFSCSEHVVRRNWKVVEAAPRLTVRITAE